MFFASDAAAAMTGEAVAINGSSFLISDGYELRSRASGFGRERQGHRQRGTFEPFGTKRGTFEPWNGGRALKAERNLHTPLAKSGCKSARTSSGSCRRTSGRQVRDARTRAVGSADADVRDSPDCLRARRGAAALELREGSPFGECDREASAIPETASWRLSTCKRLKRVCRKVPPQPFRATYRTWMASVSASSRGVLRR